MHTYAGVNLNLISIAAFGFISSNDLVHAMRGFKLDDNVRAKTLSKFIPPFLQSFQIHTFSLFD